MSSTFTVPHSHLNTRQTTQPTTAPFPPDNTGAAVVSQQATFTGVAAAGAISTTRLVKQPPLLLLSPLVLSFLTLSSTQLPPLRALVGGVITVAVDAVTVGTITANTTGGVIDMAFTATTTAAAEAANNGTADSVVTFTWARTSITEHIGWRIVCKYTARNIDGSIIPYGSGYTNN